MFAARSKPLCGGGNGDEKWHAPAVEEAFLRDTFYKVLTEVLADSGQCACFPVVFNGADKRADVRFTIGEERGNPRQGGRAR